ncbi:MAG: DoxX family protein [Gammaproteobacteria bacterium]
MTLAPHIAGANRLASRAVSPLATPLLLSTRLYVAWQFLKAGWLKITSWETTLFLFEEEYRVPLVPPAVAAALGTAGEIVFPLFLIAGLFSRYAAAGLFAVNVLAVAAYSHVLLAEGSEAAIAQHYLWGVMLLVLVVFGSGTLSFDALADRQTPAAGPSRGATANQPIE